MALREDTISAMDVIGKLIIIQVGKDLLQTVLIPAILPATNVGQLGRAMSLRVPRWGQRKMLPTSHSGLVAVLFQAGLLTNRGLRHFSETRNVKNPSGSLDVLRYRVRHDGRTTRYGAGTPTAAMVVDAREVLQLG